MSAEYLTAYGTQRDSGERGIRTFETATRNTCDIAPSQSCGTDSSSRNSRPQPCGQEQLVPFLSRAAVAIGADGPGRGTLVPKSSATEPSLDLTVPGHDEFVQILFKPGKRRVC
jgi:3-deoxy-D-arabino-heptulosonate 7-phosphate (DAHP) synthase